MDIIPEFQRDKDKIEIKLYPRKIKKDTEKTMGLHIGCSSTIDRRYDPNRFAKIIIHFVKKYNVIPVFFGTKLDLEDSKIVMKTLDNLNIKYIDYLCKLKLEETIDHIATLDFMIANDSGLAHVAIACKIPTASIFTIGRMDLFGPRKEINPICYSYL